MSSSKCDTAPEPLDAVLVMSFGGPEQPAEVMPFLRRVTGGRVPDARLSLVADHYLHFDGRSPINEQNRRLCEHLAAALAERGFECPLALGNRFWHPLTAEAVEQLVGQGARDIAVVATSGFASWPGCRAYQEDYEEVADRIPVGKRPRFRKVRLWYNHPVFLDCWGDRVVEAIGAPADIGPASSETPFLVFTTHSLPWQMAQDSGVAGTAYVAQHRFVADRVARRAAGVLGRSFDWELSFQSQSGGGSGQPWLTPTIDDTLRDLAARGVGRVVVAPIGFVTDHMEVMWDLGVEARQMATDLGLEFTLARTIGDDPRFVSMLAELVLERSGGAMSSDRPAEGPDGPWPDECPTGCCQSGKST
ncbi:MAG: ferrochelatase [Candidatus Nanopelagicales bacterium]|nr:ferrochelatase [Candidatus Nanopelagicales bacterium]